MSIAAINWALAQSVRPSSTKFVLLVLANFANRSHLVWHSVASIQLATCQDRKTVLKALSQLVRGNWISDTGGRQGATRQVPVYRVNCPIDEQLQKRNGSELGTVPATMTSGPNMPREQCRDGGEAVPKAGHGILENQKKESSETCEVPHQSIVDLYNRHLAKLPKVRVLTEERRQAITAAWYESQEMQNVAFWEAYFEECASDDFLNGTGPYSNGHDNWLPSFDYLIRSKTVTRVYEKAMHLIQKKRTDELTR